MDGRLDDRGVQAQLGTACDLVLDGLLHHPVEQRSQGRPLDEMAQLDQRLVVGDAACVDAAEPAIHQTAGHFAAQ
jgi:hypothetical protein